MASAVAMSCSCKNFDVRFAGRYLSLLSGVDREAKYPTLLLATISRTRMVAAFEAFGQILILNIVTMVITRKDVVTPVIFLFVVSSAAIHCAEGRTRDARNNAVADLHRVD